jgi:hypothetical protein
MTDWLTADEDAAPCASCGAPLRLDPDEIPEDVAGGPMCGDCVRRREGGDDSDAIAWDPDEGG